MADILGSIHAGTSNLIRAYEGATQERRFKKERARKAWERLGENLTSFGDFLEKRREEDEIAQINETVMGSLASGDLDAAAQGLATLQPRTRGASDAYQRVALAVAARRSEKDKYALDLKQHELDTQIENAKIALDTRKEDRELAADTEERTTASRTAQIIQATSGLDPVSALNVALESGVPLREKTLDTMFDAAMAQRDREAKKELALITDERVRALASEKDKLERDRLEARVNEAKSNARLKWYIAINENLDNLRDYGVKLRGVKVRERAVELDEKEQAENVRQFEKGLALKERTLLAKIAGIKTGLIGVEADEAYKTARATAEMFVKNGDEDQAVAIMEAAEEAINQKVKEDAALVKEQLAKAETAAPTQTAPSETKQIGGKTFKKVDGKWVPVPAGK